VRAGSASAETLSAPMHGRIVQVHVAPGQSVAAGTLLVVMEAMKMEHQLTAQHDGTVTAVHAKPGDQVAARKLLVEVARA